MNISSIQNKHVKDIPFFLLVTGELGICNIVQFKQAANPEVYNINICLSFTQTRRLAHWHITLLGTLHIRHMAVSQPLSIGSN